MWLLRFQSDKYNITQDSQHISKQGESQTNVCDDCEGFAVFGLYLCWCLGVKLVSEFITRKRERESGWMRIGCNELMLCCKRLYFGFVFVKKFLCAMFIYCPGKFLIKYFASDDRWWPRLNINTLTTLSSLFLLLRQNISCDLHVHFSWVIKIVNDITSFPQKKEIFKLIPLPFRHLRFLRLHQSLSCDCTCIRSNRSNKKWRNILPLRKTCH